MSKEHYYGDLSRGRGQKSGWRGGQQSEGHRAGRLNPCCAHKPSGDDVLCRPMGSLGLGFCISNGLPVVLSQEAHSRWQRHRARDGTPFLERAR